MKAFNGAYNNNVKTNVVATFLRLVDKHFQMSSPLRKLIYRNSLKLGYSCVKNV